MPRTPVSQPHAAFLPNEAKVSATQNKLKHLRQSERTQIRPPLGLPAGYTMERWRSGLPFRAPACSAATDPPRPLSTLFSPKRRTGGVS
jgi:hypothetical protein